MTSMPRIGTSAAESSWPNVRWDHSADIEARPLRIINEIRGDGQEADYIRSLITNRTLAWTAEVRCPSTAFSHTSWACDPEMTVDLAELNDSVLNRDRFLVCGLVAAETFTMDTKGTLPIYQPTVEVAAGSWLCSQSLVYEIGSPIHSLLVWKVNNDLEEGRLSVRSVGPLRYEALARRDLFDEIVEYRRQDIWVAALIAALSDLHEEARKSEEEMEEDNEHQPSDALAYFRRYDIPRGDLFNAAEAATMLAPFDITPREISDYEDDQQ